MKTLAERQKLVISLNEEGDSVLIQQESNTGETDCILIPICDLPLFIEHLKAEAESKPKSR